MAKKNWFLKYLNGLYKFFSMQYYRPGENGDNLLSNTLNKLTGSGLTASEKEANQFNADEAEKNRQFQEQQRQTQIQTSVADAKKAGVNPATLYGSSAVSAGTTGGSSASSATSGDSNPGALTALLGTLGSIFAKVFDTTQRTQVEQKKIDMQTDYNRIMGRYYTTMAGNNTALVNSQIALNQSQIDIASAKIPNIQADTLIKMAQQKNIFADTDLKKAQKAYTEVQSALSRIDQSKRSRYLEASISYMAAQTAVQEQLYNYYQSSSSLNWAKELDVYTLNDLHQIQVQSSNKELKMLAERAEKYGEFLDAELKQLQASGDLTAKQAEQLKSELVLKYITGIGNTLANVGKAAASFTPQGQFLNTIGNVINPQPTPTPTNMTFF